MRDIGEIVMILMMLLAGIAQAAGDYKAEAQPKIFKKIYQTKNIFPPGNVYFSLKIIVNVNKNK